MHLVIGIVVRSRLTTPISLPHLWVSDRVLPDTDSESKVGKESFLFPPWSSLYSELLSLTTPRTKGGISLYSEDRSGPETEQHGRWSPSPSMSAFV